jgi:SNF2 family DNA or RNA helicase
LGRSELSRPRTLLQRFGFWRIALDEAQNVANTNSVAAAAASSLWRRHAW